MGRITRDPKNPDPYIRALRRIPDAPFDARAEYLKQLADDYGQPLKRVKALANMLGKDEDFDGLISALNDLPIE